MLNETNILSSILDIPVKPEPSFQVSPVEQNAGERFDHVFRGRVDSHRNEAPPAPSQKFEAKERPTPEHSGHKDPVARDEAPRNPQDQPNDSRPVTPDGERRNPAPLNDDATRFRDDELTPKERINPFTLPPERLAPDLKPIDTVDSLLNTRLNAEAPSAIDMLKEFLAGLNIDSETFDQLVAALNNGDAAGVQNILTALRGLLQASNPAVQVPGSEIVAEVAANRLNPSEQHALNLLIRAGLTRKEAQQVIQQTRFDNIPQPNTENST